MRKNEFLTEARKLINDEISLPQALAQIAEDVLTRYDCEQWHKGKLTRQTASLAAAFRAAGEDGFQLWGGVDDFEPLTIIPHA